MACSEGCPDNWCDSGCRCYGCLLIQKAPNIAGETVAGHTFGAPHYRALTDTAEDQGVAAGKEWMRISKQMQAGGAVAEDALQQPCEVQRSRSMDAAAAVGARGTIPERYAKSKVK